jgi:hypothetical protein
MRGQCYESLMIATTLEKRLAEMETMPVTKREGRTTSEAV